MANVVRAAASLLTIWSVVMHFTVLTGLGIHELLYFRVISPDDISYIFSAAPAKDFGGCFTSFYDEIFLVPAEPADACSDLKDTEILQGQVVLVERGGCSFVEKAHYVEEAGGKAVLLLLSALSLFFSGFAQHIIDFHLSLFSAFSTLTPTICMSSLTTSIYLLFGLPLFLLPGSSISNILLPMYPLSLLCTCPNHLNLASLAFSPNLPVCVVPLMTSFLILSILVTPKENLSIFISSTSSSTSCLLLIATISKPYIMAGLPIIL
uniref:Protease associated domain containing 1 n=1 Tax=Cynoglossus semilaevis TaxID=244447 RepID=A0A3P8WWC6_CYNSE